MKKNVSNRRVLGGDLQVHSPYLNQLRDSLVVFREWAYPSHEIHEKGDRGG